MFLFALYVLPAVLLFSLVLYLPYPHHALG